MAAPIRPAANACSLAKNSKQNLEQQGLQEKPRSLSGLTMDFEHPVARAISDRANLHVEQEDHECVESGLWWAQTFGHECCPIRGPSVAL